MKNPVSAVPAFSSQVEVILGTVEWDSHFNEVPNSLRAGSYDEINYFGMTQAVSRIQGILDVKAERVVRSKNGSYSTLSVVCAGFKPVFFCYNCDRSVASCFQGECETSDSAADDEIIELIFHCGFPILRSKSRCRIS